MLEWVAFPFSRGSSQPRDQIQVSCIAGGFFTDWATRKAFGFTISSGCHSLWRLPVLCKTHINQNLYGFLLSVEFYLSHVTWILRSVWEKAQEGKGKILSPLPFHACFSGLWCVHAMVSRNPGGQMFILVGPNSREDHVCKTGVMDWSSHTPSQLSSVCHLQKILISQPLMNQTNGDLEPGGTSDGNIPPVGEE